MLKKIVLIAAFTTIALTTWAQKNTLTRVMNKYADKWYKTLSFTQTTTLFTPKGEVKQTWYEAGSLPNFFRIDFDKAKGSSVIFEGEKEYYFRENKLVHTGKNNNPLIYLLGGMYFDNLDTVKSKLTKIGINTNIGDTDNWKGKKVLVIGAAKGDTTKSQLWYDAKELYLVRFIQKDKNMNMDIHFAGHQQVGKVWHETIVDIYKNDKMIQKEEYTEFKTDIKLNPAIFDPQQFGQVHWLNH